MQAVLNLILGESVAFDWLKAWQNGYAERLMRTIKEEEVDLSEYECYTDAVSTGPVPERRLHATSAPLLVGLPHAGEFETAVVGVTA